MSHNCPALLALLTLAACAKAPTGPAPHQIHIAGSSAGFLLSSEVAERLMREDPDVLAPLVRAGGTGEGIARFCDKANPTRPDILITTRLMTTEEQARCAANGSADVEQKQIGTTAVVLVEAKGAAPISGLNRIDVAKALTSDAKTWADVRASLPAIPIAIHGPTPTPAIADTLYGPVLQEGQKVRTDGAYAGHGADAALVARMVAEKPGTIGIVPIAQFLAHHETLSRMPLDQVGPIPLYLVTRPSEARPAPGLIQLQADYAEALSRHRGDIAPAHLSAR